MKIRCVVALLLLVAIGLRVEAQSNLSLATRPVTSNTVGSITNLSIVDGRIYYYSSSMLFSGPITKHGIGLCDVDLSFSNLGPGVSYVVRHPVSRQLFYTRTDSKGRTMLFERDSLGNSKQHKLGKFSGSICHPAFSSDGLIMVFSSDAPKGQGGYDLWYSLFVDDEWQAPVNMGSRVNTPGDEFSPSIAKGFLYFTSDGRDASSSDFDVYSTLLVASTHQFGDTVVSFPIGMSPVQKVVSPISTSLHESDFVIDSSATMGLWTSRGTFGTDDDHLQLFRGRLDCVHIQIHILTAINDQQPSQIQVSSSSGDPLFQLASDNNGFCEFYLQPGERYVVEASHPNCFSSTFDVLALRGLHDSLYTHQQYDLFLGGFMLGNTYRYDNHLASEAFFSSSVSDKLSDVGRAVLDRLLLFLTDNPSVDLYLSVVCQPQTDADSIFCSMLGEYRLDAIRSYLSSKNMPGTMFSRCHLATTLQTTDQEEPSQDDKNQNLVIFRMEENR